MGHTQTLYNNWSLATEAVSKIVRPFLRSRYPWEAQTSPGLSQKRLYTELIGLPFERSSHPRQGIMTYHNWQGVKDTFLFIFKSIEDNQSHSNALINQLSSLPPFCTLSVELGCRSRETEGSVWAPYPAQPEPLRGRVGSQKDNTGMTVYTS